MNAKPLLVTNEHYLPTLLTLLEHAQSKIDIVAFSFAMGFARGQLSGKSAPYQIVEKLIALKKRRKNKIQIRLYIEGHRETADRNEATAEYLRNAGVQVKYGSTHAKGFSIDDRFVFFGSTNLTNQSIMKNNESNLVFDDAKVSKGFNKYFEHLWSGGKHAGVKLPPPLIADGGFLKVLLQMIDDAKKTLEFSIYFFHFTDIEKAFVRAHKRGVKIRGFFHDHKSFALSYVKRTRGTAERLLKAGIKDINFGPNHLFTHSKFLISDREELLLGTGNWLHEDVDVHPQLYVKVKSKAIAKELAKVLQSQIKVAKAKG